MESSQRREAWNKGKLVGQKPPLKPKDIWVILVRQTLLFVIITQRYTKLWPPLALIDREC